MKQDITNENIFDFKRFRWYLSSARAGGLYVFLSVFGIIITFFQTLIARIAEQPDAIRQFYGAMRFNYFLMGGVGVSSLLLGLAMIKKWRLAKWGVGILVVIGQIVCAPLFIRAMQDYANFFHRIAEGAQHSNFLSVFIQFSMDVWNLAIPIALFGLLAVANLISIVFEESKSVEEKTFVNRPPG